MELSNSFYFICNPAQKKVPLLNLVISIRWCWLSPAWKNILGSSTSVTRPRPPSSPPYPRRLSTHATSPPSSTPPCTRSTCWRSRREYPARMSPPTKQEVLHQNQEGSQGSLHNNLSTLLSVHLVSDWVLSRPSSNLSSVNQLKLET